MRQSRSTRRVEAQDDEWGKSEEDATHLDARVETARQDEVPAPGEELDAADALGVAAPRVDAPLGDEALLLARRAAQVDALDVGRDVQVRAPEVVVRLLACAGWGDRVSESALRRGEQADRARDSPWKTLFS